MKKYPKTIYVVRENEGADDEYLLVLADPSECEVEDYCSRIVAEYTLSPRRLVVSRRIEVEEK